MPPAGLNLVDGSTLQPDLACQLILAEAASPAAGRDAATDLDPCLLVCHSAIIAPPCRCLNAEPHTEMQEAQAAAYDTALVAGMNRVHHLA